jgi:hypothetical protein
LNVNRTLPTSELHAIIPDLSGADTESGTHLRRRLFFFLLPESTTRLLCNKPRNLHDKNRAYLIDREKKIHPDFCNWKTVLTKAEFIDLFIGLSLGFFSCNK